MGRWVGQKMAQTIGYSLWMTLIAKCRVYVERDKSNSIKLMIKIKGFLKKHSLKLKEQSDIYY